MAKKNINIKDETDAVSEPIADYGTAITIPVSVPTMGGYTVESLRQELTEYALKLVKCNQLKVEDVKVTKSYSPRLQKLHSMSKMLITEEDIDADERLRYLLDK